MTNPQNTLNPDSDQDNADLLVLNYKDKIRYCTDSRTWFAWHENKWVIDPEANIVSNYWTKLARQINQFLPQTNNNPPKANPHYKYSLSRKGQEAAVAVARKDPRIQVLQSSFDANPYELNTPCGIVDLRTATLNKANRDSLHTKETLVAPKFDPPHRWLAFLDEVFQGDQDTIDYVQRLMGLSLVGEVVEQVFPFAHGPGGTGKSTFLNTMLDVAGDYGQPASATLLMRNTNAHPEEIAKLRGVRICVMLEFNQDDRFNEAKLKSLTGADKLDARLMRQNSFSFRPTHTLFLAGNSKPTISEGGTSIFRRMRRIPFVNEEFKSLDKTLHSRLIQTEAAQILGWMVQGAKLYLNDSQLLMPAAVALATAEYEQEEDTLGQFLEEECTIDSDSQCSHKQLKQKYDEWCDSYGYRNKLGPKKLTEKLTSSKKYGNIRTGKLDRNTRGYFGIRITSPDRVIM